MKEVLRNSRVLSIQLSLSWKQKKKFKESSKKPLSTNSQVQRSKTSHQITVLQNWRKVFCAHSALQADLHLIQSSKTPHLNSLKVLQASSLLLQSKVLPTIHTVNKPFQVRRRVAYRNRRRKVKQIILAKILPLKNLKKEMKKKKKRRNG